MRISNLFNAEGIDALHVSLFLDHLELWNGDLAVVYSQIRDQLGLVSDILVDRLLAILQRLLERLNLRLRLKQRLECLLAIF